MRHLRSSLTAAVLSVFISAPVAARINMMEPWSPGLDFRVPTNRWNHDVHSRMGFGQKSRDFFELGYILATPVTPDWEVGAGLNFLSVDHPGGSESGLSDISLGAKYKLPQGWISPSMGLIGEAGLTLPTGDADKGLGAGGLGFFMGGGFQGAMADDVTGYAHLGFRLFLKGQDTDLGEVFQYAFGVKYRVDADWIASADVRGFNHGRDEYDGFKTDSYQEVYLAPGVAFRPTGSRVEYLGALLLGLTDDSYDFGLQVSAKF